MFCCGGLKCLDDEEAKRDNKGRGNFKQQNQQIYIQRNGIAAPTKVNGKMPSNMHNYITKENANVLKSDVKHVTNVRNDIYVKLNGPMKTNGNSKTVGYQRGVYNVVHISKSHSAAVRQTQKRVPISELKPMPEVRVNARASEPVRDSMRLSSEFVISDADNRTSTPMGMTIDDAVAVFGNNDTDSLTNEQRHALDELENTIAGFRNESDDDEMPMIIADVLPDGVFEAFTNVELPSPTESSEDEPSSRTSSLSNKSINSRTGIISGRQSTRNRKSTNSVSFQLPEDHVDKPYAPMQTCSKQKQTKLQAPEAPKITSTVCVTAPSMNIWHQGNIVYVENKQKRGISGPFKGSFKSLFYGKYSNPEISGFKEFDNSLSPKILERVESFESLIGDDKCAPSFHGNRAVVRSNSGVSANQRSKKSSTAVERRNTFR